MWCRYVLWSVNVRTYPPVKDVDKHRFRSPEAGSVYSDQRQAHEMNDNEFILIFIFA